MLAVCYWGRRVEEHGPWRALADLTAPPQPAADWEAGIPGLAVLERAEVLVDERVTHAMRWGSLDAFWKAGISASLPPARDLGQGAALRCCHCSARGC